MRRFYGYLALIVTLIVVVFSNLQTQIQGIKSSIEYSGGYEILYSVDLKDSKKDVEDISNIVVKRLEDAKVQNPYVESESGDTTDFVRIRMSGDSEQNIDYVLRSVEATGKLTVSTLMDDANFAELENPFVIGSAEVEWNESNPYVKVEVKDCKEFINFVENCNSDYEDFNKKYNQNEDENNTSDIKGVMVIWLDKADDDSYIEAYKNENIVTKEKIRDKILAIVPTNNFSYETDSNGEYTNVKLLISYYDFEQTQMVTESAHTVERIINYGASDYSMTRLYTQRIDSTTTDISGYDQIIMWGVFAALIIVGVYLIVTYGLAGLTGCVAIFTSMFAQFAFFNFFDYALSSIGVIGFIASFVINSAAVIIYLSKFKNELYKGKSASKANQEANKSTLVNVIDYSILGLLVSVVGIVAFSSQITLLPIIILLGTVGNLVITRLIVLFAMWWLTNNKLANENSKIFMVNKKDVPDIMKMETQSKFAPLSNADVRKYGKKSTITGGIVTGVLALLIAILAIIPGVNVFNDSQDSKQYSRIEISSEVVKSHYLFEGKQAANEFFKNNYPDLVVENIDINVVKDVALDAGKENLADVVYISVKLDNVIDGDAIIEGLQEKLSKQDNVDSEAINVEIVKCAPKSVNYVFGITIVAVSIFIGLAILFILVRFGLDYALASLVTFIPTALVAFGFFSATRLAISALSLAGIAAGLLIIAIAQIPFFERIKKLKHDSKTKITTFEQKEEITVAAFKDTIFVSLSILAAALVATIIIAFFSPLTSAVLSNYGTVAITIVVGGLATYFVLLPVYLFFEKNIRFNLLAKNKEKRIEKITNKNINKMKEAKKANKNSGAEPEESKIPGINC